MSTVQDPDGGGSANVVDAVTPGSLVGKKSLVVHVDNPSTGGDATEATLTTLLTEADFDARIGEVQATPTPNTVLARLKGILDKLNAFIVARMSDGAGNALTSTAVGGSQALDVNIAAGSSGGPTATEGAAIGNTGVPYVGKDANGNAQFSRISPLGVVSIEAGDYAGDADRRLRVTEAQTLFSGKVIHDKQPLLYKEQLVGTATSTFNPNLSSVSLTTVNPGDKAIRQSAYYPAYQPNKTQKVASTFLLNPATAGLVQSAGIFDQNDGLFFRLNGTAPEIVLRSSTTGSPVETVVPQSSWNVDHLDGTGPSGATVDFTKAQHLVIDYLWLGVGPARIGFRNGGDVVYVHRFNNDNVGTGVYMSSPTLPVRWEIEQTGATGGTMECFCSSVESEGGIQIEGIQRGFMADTGVLFNIGEEKPLLSIRLKSAFIRSFVKTTEIGILADDKFDATFKWVLNPTFTGGTPPTWVPQTNSVVEVDTVRTGTYNNDGYCLQVGGFSDKTRSVARISDREGALGADPAGVSDELVLIVKHRGQNTAGNVYPFIHWVETA